MRFWASSVDTPVLVATRLGQVRPIFLADRAAHRGVGAELNAFSSRHSSLGFRLTMNTASGRERRPAIHPTPTCFEAVGIILLTKIKTLI
jgi:hypothetical protein